MNPLPLQALNKIGFYQACFNYIMPGNIQQDGQLEEFSEDYVFLVHKDSKALFPSAQTDFVLELDRYYHHLALVFIMYYYDL